MMMKKMLLMVAVLAVAMAAKADCWMTFRRTPTIIPQAVSMDTF